MSSAWLPSLHGVHEMRGHRRRRASELAGAVAARDADWCAMAVKIAARTRTDGFVASLHSRTAKSPSRLGKIILPELSNQNSVKRLFSRVFDLLGGRHAVPRKHPFSRYEHRQLGRPRSE